MNEFRVESRGVMAPLISPFASLRLCAFALNISVVDDATVVVTWTGGTGCLHDRLPALFQRKGAEVQRRGAAGNRRNNQTVSGIPRRQKANDAVGMFAR